MSEYIITANLLFLHPGFEQEGPLLTNQFILLSIISSLAPILGFILLCTYVTRMPSQGYIKICNCLSDRIGLPGWSTFNAVLRLMGFKDLCSFVYIYSMLFTSYTSGCPAHSDAQMLILDIHHRRQCFWPNSQTSGGGSTNGSRRALRASVLGKGTRWLLLPHFWLGISMQIINLSKTTVSSCWCNDFRSWRARVGV